MISSSCCHNPEEERGSVTSHYKRLLTDSCGDWRGASEGHVNTADQFIRSKTHSFHAAVK